MKLRIHENNIRLRLSRTEVIRLARGESIENNVDLGPETLRYLLRSVRNRAAPAATFRAGELCVQIPTSLVERWASTDEVGIEATLPASALGREPLTLLIEKDFRCLHGSIENQEDCFANPLAQEMKR